MATTVTVKPNAIDLSGSTSGTTTLQATAVAGTTVLTLPAATDTLVGKATTDTLTNKTLTSPILASANITTALTLTSAAGTSGQVLTSAGSGNAPTWTTLASITSGTAVASTSGTSIDFTGIPSSVKRITVMFNGVSTSGTSNYLVRIGNTTFTVTGYVSTMTYVNIGANSSTGITDTTGYVLTKDVTAATSFSGVMTICLLSNYVYVASFNGIGNGGPTFQGGGVLNLGSVLDRVRITTVNGTDTFDAGSINILFE